MTNLAVRFSSIAQLAKAVIGLLQNGNETHFYFNVLACGT